MTTDSALISGSHRTMLIHELLHAFLVLFVVICATVLTVVKPQVISGDLLSFVYGGALQYAGARAAAIRQTLGRSGDTPPVP